MQPEVLKYLCDIGEAGELIARFVGNRTLDVYMGDPILRSAVERQLIIVGEGRPHPAPTQWERVRNLYLSGRFTTRRREPSDTTNVESTLK